MFLRPVLSRVYHATSLVNPREAGEEKEEPGLRVLERLGHLRALEVLVLNAGLVDLQPADGNHALFGRQETGRDW
jgi:hypothetical protein